MTVAVVVLVDEEHELVELAEPDEQDELLESERVKKKLWLVVESDLRLKSLLAAVAVDVAVSSVITCLFRLTLPVSNIEEGRFKLLLGMIDLETFVVVKSKLVGRRSITLLLVGVVAVPLDVVIESRVNDLHIGLGPSIN